MSSGNVLTRLYDAFSSVLISIMTILCDMWYLQFCSYAHTYWNLGNKPDEEYSLLKQDRFCLLFICLCFSLKPASVLQSILLVVHVLFLLV